MSRRLLPVGVLMVLMSAGLLILPARADEKPSPKESATETSSSATAEKFLVSDVIVQGSQRMSIEQIKMRLYTQAGKEYDPAALDEDVLELYKTRQFSSIQTLVEPDGPDKVKVHLFVADLPNPVQKVSFLGAKHIKDEELRKETGVRPGMPLNPKLNEEGCQKILNKYEEQGRSFASCALVKGGHQGDTEVVYQITEGPKVKVRDIQFTGNTFVSGARLATKLRSETVWFHVLGGNYSSKMAEADTHELIKYFKKLGYQDVKASLEAQRSADGREVTLIFHIHEGPRYTVKGTPQSIDGQTIPQEQLELMLTPKSGESHDENKVNVDKKRIKDYYGYTGRDVQVQDRYVWSADEPGVSPVQYETEEHPAARCSPPFKINEPATVCIGQIFITGNKRISSESILAHLALYPGAILTFPDLKEAEKTLAELDLFVVDPVKGVRPTITVIDQDDSVYKDILITVKEKKARAKGGKSE